MVTSHRQHGDHFEMYRDTESLCCITGNNVVLQVDYTSKTKTHRKRGWRQGWGELEESSQMV